MGLQIEDGKGSGKLAQVDSENRLITRAVVEEQDLHINKVNNKVWSIPFEGLNPAAGDDYVLYIKNTGTKTINMTGIRIMADTASTQIEVHAVTGTASGGSAITPINRTIGASPIPDAIIESGTDITGLTSDGILYFIQCAVIGTEYPLKVSSTIRIPQDKAMAILVETGTANITGTVCLVEEE